MSGACAQPWSYHVLVLVEGEEYLSRLGAMEVWLRQWEIPYRVVSPPPDSGAVRVSFCEDRYARAFQIRFGALRVGEGDAAQPVAKPAEIGARQTVGGA
jgi:hypothetical protein